MKPKLTVDALKVILGELVRLRDGVDEEELAKAKELSKGRLMLRLEDTRSVAGWMGGQELLLGEVRTPDHVVQLVPAHSGLVPASEAEQVAGDPRTQQQAVAHHRAAQVDVAEAQPQFLTQLVLLVHIL